MRCWRSPRTLALLVLVTLAVLVLTAASDGFFYGGRGPQFFFNGQPMGGDRGPVDNQGYYDCLGVSKGADDNAIKKAYRRLAVKLHPDKEGGDPERFKELGEAYAVLSDPDKRRTYDQYGKARRARPTRRTNLKFHSRICTAARRGACACGRRRSAAAAARPCARPRTWTL
eukprot:TRINITY_DN10769_c0_g1_i1.p1 TRINITY_DN10769_c0_g1~~TRINITY_DN10769_c0_g1_i1.p1  ORF type:complete len:171 (-),score=24.51 TRINITY_DN10769_c0_g1_i1:241-753(-)